MTSDDLIVNLVIPAVKIAVVLGVVSGLVAYVTLLERKVLGFMQLRLAPRRVGPHGLLQPIADGIKLLIKEDLVPDGADRKRPACTARAIHRDLRPDRDVSAPS